MKTTAYVTHPDCSRHDTGWRHPEHQGRLPAVARAVYRDMLTLFEPLLEVEARPAEREELRLAHTAEYVERVRAAAAEAELAGRVLPLLGETVVSGASWDAAVAATGAALTAVELVLDGTVRNAFCAVRPPGQSAGADRPGGFALFNHTAVAARYLTRRRHVEPVLVVELGAAAGGGTAEILAGDAGVRLLSVTRGEGAGEPAGVSVSLAPGSDGAVAAAALEQGLERALAGEIAPAFVLLSLGFDALRSDPLGGLCWEPADYHALTGVVRQRAERHCSGRLVSVLEGGYDPRGTGEAVVQHLRALADLPPA